MEQQDKYYTPNIEDIRVGYECGLWENDKCFIKGIITEIYQGTEDTKRCLGLCFDNGNGYLIDKYREIRTPYLTKEQIEAEGWKLKHDYSSLGNGLNFEKGDIWKDGAFLTYDPYLKIIKVTTTDKGFNSNGPNSSIKFQGECKSINEFRYITNKLLNIN